MSQRKPSAIAHVFSAPALIATATLLGLVSALLGDGLPDWIAWVGLTAPVLVIAWALATRRT